jgi:uracil-DNA glycosylase
MQSELTNELAALISDTREDLTYFHELGVENIEAPPSAVMTWLRDKPKQREEVLSPAGSISTVAPLPSNTGSAGHGSSASEVQPRGSASPALPSLFDELVPAAEALPKSSETFAEIWRDIGNCTRCPLYQARTNIVHTDGNQRARLMFVGEAPGADEDAQGFPFVGRAGQLLTKIIEAIGFKREDVLIGNVNRCRPPANRPPTPEEAAMCKPFLLREIAAVRPEVIVVLGNTAMRNLLDTKVGITKLRGQFQDYQGAKVMPTFHPAYLLRDPSKKKETWADLKMVRDYLDASRKRSN